MATAIGTRLGRATGSWHALEKMEPYQVAVALGSVIAILVGIVWAVVLPLAGSTIPVAAVAAGAVELIVFGVLVLVAYRVMKKNVRNGVVAAGIGGLCMLFLAGNAAGILTGLVILIGTVWGYAKSR